MRREGMPEVDEIACVKPPRSWTRDFYFCVGRQVIKAVKRIQPYKLEHWEDALPDIHAQVK